MSTKPFDPVKGGHEMFYPVLGGGGGEKGLRPTIFSICSPLPVINHRSPNGEFEVFSKISYEENVHYCKVHYSISYNQGLLNKCAQ